MSLEMHGGEITPNARLNASRRVHPPSILAARPVSIIPELIESIAGSLYRYFEGISNEIDRCSRRLAAQLSSRKCHCEVERRNI
jgi:hypothetical protein